LETEQTTADGTDSVNEVQSFVSGCAAVSKDAPVHRKESF